MSFIKITRSQKGAMFGLDARIALAIFGGLSVIAGAAIFSAISDTKITALITELDNFGKGYVGHALDTGADTATIADLWADSSVAGWKGPYVTATTANHLAYGVYSLVPGRPDLVEKTPGTTVCASPNLCATWLRLTLVTNSIAEEVDKRVDTPGSLTPDTGNVRLEDPASGTRTLFYKLAGCQTPTCT
jgi:hypothetical protein